MALVKLNNNGVKNATSFGSVTSLGSIAFIKKLTASSSATLSFVDGSADVDLDNTYREYLVTFNNIHPATDGAFFQFNPSSDTGSNYNVTKTSTAVRQYHTEAGSSPLFDYLDGLDLAQSTAFQTILENQGNGNDESLSGYLRLFEPSSTTFVKHFMGIITGYQLNNAVNSQYTAGYCNTTSVVDAVQFKFSSGNIDAGDICLYGIS